MKRTLTLLLLAAALLLCACAGTGETAKTEPAATQAPATELDRRGAGLTDADLPALYAETALVRLDLRDNEISADGFDALAAALPSCDILWSVPIGSARFESDSAELTLPAETDSLDVLAYFPNLTRVDATACTCYDALSAAAERLPDCAFIWKVAVCGGEALNTDETLAIDAAAFDADALIAGLNRLPAVKSVDLGGAVLDSAQMEQLSSACPEVTFNWRFTFCGQEVSAETTELDVSGYEITDAAAFEKQLPYLPKLTKIDMCECGLDNAQMETLVNAHPSVKFVWMIQVGGWTMRTDVKAFSKGNRKSFEGGRFNGGKTNLDNDDIAPLKYCTDLVALDLGHGRAITDISVIRNLPKLRFLIVAMEGITDISAVTACPELEYVETFQNKIEDISPLLSLKKLTHLNCSTNFFTDISVLEQMTQLQRLWIIHSKLDKAQIAELKEKLPDCVINTSGVHSTSNGWRDNALYREMQGLFNLPISE